MALLTTYRVRQSDTPDALPLQILDADRGNAPYPLDGLAVTARLYGVAQFGQAHTQTPLFADRPCTVTDPGSGIVALPWAAGDLATPGRYELDVAIWQGATHIATVRGLRITIVPQA